MSENPTNEYIEEPTFSEKDQADLDKLLADEPVPEYHTLLEVWTNILSGANLDANRRVTMKWANGIIGQYQGLGFGDMKDFTEVYFGIIEDMVAILEFEIASDEDCLKPSTPADDVELNAAHYKNLLGAWQQAMLVRELGWDCESPTAAHEIAALAEAHKVFFGSNGLTGHLEALKFDFTEADQQDLADILAGTIEAHEAALAKAGK